MRELLINIKICWSWKSYCSQKKIRDDNDDDGVDVGGDNDGCCKDDNDLTG